MKVTVENIRIGDEFYYMKHTSPTKGKVVGIATVEGVMRINVNNKENETVYAFDDYTIMRKDELFSTKQELIDSMFSKLK